MLPFTALLLAAAAPAAYCDNPETPAQEQACAEAAFDRIEGDLNAQWQRTADTMKARDREYQRDGEEGWFPVLLAAQRAWIDYREAHCLSAAPRLRPRPDDHAIQMIICRNSMGLIRIEQLKELEEGMG